MLFLCPAIAVFCLIFIKSLVTLVGTSFTEYYIGSTPIFNGGVNYINVWKDESFRMAALNTVIWVVMQSTLNVALGVTVAIILARKKWYWKIVRSIYMIPNIIPAAAVGLMFVFMLNPQYGVVNNIIQHLGFPDFNTNWFYDPSTAFFAVSMTWLPYAATITILTLAEMGAIDSSMYEAASVDGATEMQTILHITLPNLRNIIGTCTILAATSMLQKLDILMMTTKGGPSNKTLNMSIYIYNSIMRTNNYGIANTAGVYLISFGLLSVLLIRKIYGIGKND